MPDLEKRLRQTFSSMAAHESLETALDAREREQMIQWGEAIAQQYVIKTSQMDDRTANEYLAPYFSALRRMMRAIGHWAVEQDELLREDWWNFIEQNGKTLYGDGFVLPSMNSILTQLPAGATVQQVIAFLQNMVEAQKAKG